MTHTSLLRAFGVFLSAKLGMETLVVAHMSLCLMPRVQLPLAHRSLGSCLSYFQDPHIPPTGGPRGPTFFFSHTTSPFPAHPFVAPAFRSPCIPNRIFSGAGFRRLAKTQREALLITLRSKKQKSASQGICPVVGLLGHVVVLFLVF